MFNIIAMSVMLIAVVMLISRVITLKKKIASPNLVYVDREGIPVNPPQYFIETFTNKVMNIRIDDEFNFTIAQIPFLYNLRYIRMIAEYHLLLIKYVDYKPAGEVERVKNDILYKKTYNAIIDMIYELSYQFSHNKKRYKKALYHRCENDVLFTLELCEQASDYWRLVKKKALLLGGQTTLRQTVGEEFSWNSVDLDGKRKIIIKSRYEQFWNSQPRKMMGYLDKSKTQKESDL